jgi:pilus assembly protein CpaB
MRLVFLLVLIVGFGVAGFAVYLAMQQFDTYEKELTVARKSSPFKLTRVFITKNPLRYGQLLKETDLDVVEWPEKGVPKNAFTDINVLIGPEGNDKFRTVIRQMDAGEVITSSKVTGIGQDAGVSAKLEKGMRAFALRVDVASGVSGFLRPGDRVDVYWTGGVNGEPITKLILQDLALIAIDQQTNEDTTKATVARTVTVAVSPRVVGELIQAQATGSLLLSLRSVTEGDTSTGTVEVTQRDLLDIKEHTVKSRRVCSIVTRKGGEAARIEIPCTN